MLAGRFRGAEKPRRHQVVVGFGRDSGKAVEGEGKEEVTLEPGRQVERVVGVAFGGVEFALRDLDARACRQGTRQAPTLGRGHDVIGPTTRRGEITACQRGQSRKVVHWDQLGIHRGKLARRFIRLPRCGRVARGKVHVGRRRVDDSGVGVKEVGCALKGDFDRRSSGVNVPLVGKRHCLKRPCVHGEHRVAGRCALLVDLVEARVSASVNSPRKTCAQPTT